jgi:hypothetical protein
LSPLVRQQLAALDRRVALAQRVRRVSVLIAVLVVLQVGFFMVSLWPGLHTAGLRMAFTALAATAIGLTAWALYRRRPDDRRLAALFEKRFPDLNERLLSIVELARAEDAHGHPAFITHLASSVDSLLPQCDPRQVVGLRRPMRRLLLSCALLMASFTLLGSDRYVRFWGRLVTAWSHDYAGYYLEVSPGSGWAARGRALTIEALIVPLEDNEVLPNECTITYEAIGYAPVRATMDRAATDRFLYSWPHLQGDVSYWIEAGELKVGPFCVTAVEPVDLAGPPEVHITPPPYVNPEVIPAQTLADGRPFNALQFSRARLNVQFTAKPVRAAVVVHDADGERELAATLDANGRIAVVDLPTDVLGTTTGTLRLEGEHGITTAHALPAWTVRPDGAPQFTQPLHVRGVRDRVLNDGNGVIAPDEPLRLQAVAEDAEGLSAVSLEYRINDAPAKAKPLHAGRGQRRIDIDHALAIGSALKPGDRLRIRLRAADNRRLAPGAIGPGVPSQELTPQIACSPLQQAGEERWLELRVGKVGHSLVRKEIAAQHGELERNLERLRQKLQKEHDLLGQVRLASHRRTELSPAQLQQLAEAGRLNDSATDELQKLAGDVEGTDELAGLADHLRAIAEVELGQAADAMAKVKAADNREKTVAVGEAAVLRAMRKLNDLGRVAERLAQGRLDRFEMERLALQEQDLARRIDDLLAAGDANDLPMAQTLAELRAEQQRLADRLKALAQESELLRDAMARAQEEQAKRLAEHAGQLAKELNSQMQGKSSGSGAGEEAMQAAQKLMDEMKELAGDTLRLAQQGGGPETKSRAGEAAHAMEESRKAMEKSAVARKAGNQDEAKAMQTESLLKLELARKNLEGMVGKESRPGAAKTAMALTEGEQAVRMASQKLQAQPSQAAKAMRQAAGSLDRTAQQMGRQLAQSMPRAAGRPAVGAGSFGQAGRVVLPPALAKQLEAFQGKSWGELPGELKTQLLQDARASFGEDYAAIIQQYFEQIAGAESPRPESKGMQP